MTTKSALDILPALVNPPFCYKLGVSDREDYRPFLCTYGISRSLHQAPVRPLSFCDLAEHKEPAETKVKKKRKKDYVYLW